MFTFFAGRAIHQTNRILWPAFYGLKRERRWFWFGSIGFWLVFGLFWAIWLMLKFELWLVLLAAILAAQVLVTVAQAVIWTFAWPFEQVRKRGERRFGIPPEQDWEWVSISEGDDRSE